MGKASVWDVGGLSAHRAIARSKGRRALADAAMFEVAELEARLLYCLDGTTHDDLNSSLLHSTPSVIVNMGPRLLTANGPALASSPLSSLPALSSDPSATATLYLDFLGAAAQTWGGYNVTATPAFDQDGDTTTFSDSELTTIRQIWARVSEAYSPFNLNVTTVDPGNLNDRQTIKVVVGGSGAWLGSAGGVSYVGSFANSAPNVAWVFPGQLGGGDPKYTGDAIVHEAGHSFGLSHQSAYSGTTKTAEYRGGTLLVAPYMGLSYYSVRGKWSNGQSSNGYSSLQDDMAVIAGSANGFGYRTDDHGDTIGTADALDVSDATVSGSGVLSKTSDVDVFSFVTSAGTVNFSVNVASYGAMLDATLKLVDLNGNVIASSDTASLGESVTATVSAGSYRLIVSSKGVYGDVGQYTVTGTIVPSPNYVAPPSNLVTTRGAGGAALNWYDNSWNETGYAVERSDDGGITWNPLDSIAANVHGYTDATAIVGHTYQYRVYAFNDTDQSTNSNVANLAFTPATPGSLTASSISASRIDLSWGDVDGETGYVLERSTNGTTWSQIATPAADSTSYSDTGLVSGTKYYYRIRASSSVGASTNATAVSATTRASQPGLTLTVVSTTQINLSWTNVLGETGYRIERSLNGSDWSVFATTGVNVVSLSSLSLTAGTVYSYRVFAVNAGGDSLAGAGFATTLLVAPTSVTATAVSTSEIDLTWANSTGETGYRVERSLDERTWTLVTTVGADVTSYANTGLVGGTRYVYRIRANNAGGSSAPSSSVGTYTVPLAPTLTAASASDTQLNLTWTNVSGETNYVLQRSDDGLSGWTTVASPLVNVVGFNNTALTADTNYSYRVVAHNASGDSAASNVVTARTLLAPVTGTTAIGVSTSEIDLSWTDTTGESGYRVERLSGTTWVLLGTTAADVHTFANTGLVAGTLYYYRVRAMNAGGASLAPVSTPATTIPLAPTLTGSVASDTQINLSWSNVAGETNYVLQRSDDGLSGWTTVASPLANVLGYSNTALTADTNYSYRVVAHNASGDSAASNVVTAHTLLAPVTGVTAVGASTTEIDISWNDTTGETGYRVERLVSGVTWTLVGTTAADVHTFANTGLVAGTLYYYRVRAVNAGGSSLVPANTPATTIPAAPTLTGTVASDTQINLGWSNVAGETNYVLQRSDDGVNGWTTIASPLVNVIGYTNTALTADTSYFYRVVAHNVSGDSAASNVVTAHTLLPAVTGLTATGVSTTEIDLSWADSNGESGYRVERSLDERTWTLVTTVGADVTSYANTGLVGGTRYIYRIRANNAGGSSAPSSSASTYTVPLAPTLTGAAVSDTQVNLAWSNVAGETNYLVQRSDDGVSGWTTITSPLANVIGYSNTALTANTSYSYRVMAHNASGDSAASAVVTVHTLMPVVSGVTAVGASTSEIDLSWTDSTGETGYRVERFVSGVTWALVGTTAADAHTFANAGLVAGTLYYYRIRAVNAGGSSLVPVNTPATTIPLATSLGVTAASTSQIRLSWSNVAGESGYRIERSSDGSTGWSVIGTAAANVISFTDTGLTTDTPYFYRVTAYNDSGSAASSTVQTTRTLIAAPVNLTAVAPSTSQVNLTWTDSTNETGYVIERSLNNGSTWATLASLAANTTSYSNTGLVAGTIYAYRVRAMNAGGPSEPGIKATVTTIPPAVTLSATAASTGQINLAWNNIAGETGYRVEKSLDGSSWTTLTTTGVNVIGYSNTGLTADTLYYYRVTPLNASGSGASTVVNRRTLLSAPTGVTATPASSSAITVSWANQSGETGYRVERLNGTTWVLVGTTAADVTTFTNTGLLAGRGYWYRVRAINSAGYSDATAALAYTPASARPASSPVFQSKRLIDVLGAAA